MSGEELAAILKSYRARKKWHRLKDGSFLPLDAPGIRQVEELAEGLCLTETQLRDGSALLPCYRAAYIDAVFREDSSASKNPGIQLKRSAYFEQLSKRMDRRNAEKINVPVSLEGIMREYQKEGFQWLQTLRQYDSVEFWLMKWDWARRWRPSHSCYQKKNMPSLVRAAARPHRLPGVSCL